MAVIIPNGDQCKPRLQMRNNVWTATAIYHVGECAGSSPLVMLANALTAPGLPLAGSSITLNGRTLYLTGFDLEDWSANEATIVYTWTEPTAQTAVNVSGGAQVEFVQSAFDYAAMQQPFASRTPLTVQYNPNGTTPNTDTYAEQAFTVPFPVVKSTRSYTYSTFTDPGALSEQFTGKVNAGAWKGRAAETVMIVSMPYRQRPGLSVYDVTINTAYDPLGKWRQIGRFKLPDGTFPKLAAGDLANNNGAKEVIVTGTANFGALPI